MDIGNLSTPALLFLTVSFTTNLFSIFIAPYQCTLTAYSCGIVLICAIILTIILIYFITWGINVIHFSGRPLISWGIAILFIYFNLSDFYSLNQSLNKINGDKVLSQTTTPLSVNSSDTDIVDHPSQYYPGQLGDDEQELDSSRHSEEEDQESSSYGQTGSSQGSSSYGQAGSSQGSSSYGQAGSSQGSSSGQAGSSQGSSSGQTGSSQGSSSGQTGSSQGSSSGQAGSSQGSSSDQYDKTTTFANSNSNTTLAGVYNNTTPYNVSGSGYITSTFPGTSYAGTTRPGTTIGSAGTTRPGTTIGAAGTTRPGTTIGATGTTYPGTTTGAGTTSPPITKDNMDWMLYVSKYRDLQDAGINTLDKAWEHYDKNGRREGRKATILQPGTTTGAGTTYPRTTISSAGTTLSGTTIGSAGTTRPGTTTGAGTTYPGTTTGTGKTYPGTTTGTGKTYPGTTTGSTGTTTGTGKTYPGTTLSITTTGTATTFPAPTTRTSIIPKPDIPPIESGFYKQDNATFRGNINDNYNKIVNGNISFSLNAKDIQTIPYVMYYFYSSGFSGSINYTDKSDKQFTFQIDSTNCDNCSNLNQVYCHKIYIDINYNCSITKTKILEITPILPNTTGALTTYPGTTIGSSGTTTRPGTTTGAGTTTYPGTTLSGTTYPGTTTGAGTTYPGTTLSGTTYPGTTLSRTTYPGTTLSGTTYPGTTLSRTTTPAIDIPNLTHRYNSNSDLQDNKVKNIAQNKYDLTIENGVTIDGALNIPFNNTGQYGAIIDEGNTIYLGNSGFTIGFWLNKSNQNTSYIFTFGKNKDSTKDSISIIYNEEDGLIARVFRSDNKIYQGIGKINNNEWNHIVWVISDIRDDNAKWTFYINGSLKDSFDKKMISYNTFRYNRIGRGLPSTTSYFDGKINDFFICNSSLSATQIQNIHSNEHP